MIFVFQNSCTPETRLSETESLQISSKHEERHRRSLETPVNGTTSKFNALVLFLLGKDAHKKINAVKKIPGGFILDVSEGKVLSSHTQVKLPKGKLIIQIKIKKLQEQQTRNLKKNSITKDRIQITVQYKASRS